MTGIGELKHRLVLEAPVETDDGVGGVTREFVAVRTLWAAVMPVATRGDVIADGEGATVSYRIVLRAGPDVTTRHRLREGDRVYGIVSLRDQGDGRFLEITAEERRD
jgi:SPP1 family predicted phage head-tail adaptor